jgi:carbamoyl-phosphate synthase small subunit
MTGYQEIFTDPSYYGQVMVMASPHIGNYGIHKDEDESDSVKIAGLVCKKFSEVWSRPGGSSSLDDFLKSNGVVGISDVDTRALVRKIRSEGAMNCIISSTEMDITVLKAELALAPSMKGLELSSKVTATKSFSAGDENAAIRVALLDLGVKKNIVRCLVDRGCYVKVFPMDTSLAEMEAFEPSGFMLSNGPGDPSAMEGTAELVASIVETGKPVFGICLGHQVLAMSQGVGTKKMHHGHRGINHPVRQMNSLHDEVTSQNHGFVVDREQAEANDQVEITHDHLNDGSVAGIRLKDKPVFSVQYHPEGSPGPHDPLYLFDDFVENMRVSENVSEPRTV